MCVGDMTTNKLKTKTNGRWPRQTEYCSNQWSYFPVLIIPQRHPRPIWMEYFWTRGTNVELTLTMTQKQKNKIPNIHEVYGGPRRSRDNDLSTEPEGYTSWVT